VSRKTSIVNKDKEVLKLEFDIFSKFEMLILHLSSREIQYDVQAKESLQYLGFILFSMNRTCYKYDSYFDSYFFSMIHT
jgi:hypothetical protein